MKKFLLNLVRLLYVPVVTTNTPNLQTNDFVADQNEFLLNGMPFIIRSGELHYSCIPKKDWDQRIKTANAMGLNTIQINLLWSYHEQDQGIFDFTGQRDIAEFIHMIQENNMYCILCPGPNVSNGLVKDNLPGWLFKKDDLNVCNYTDKFFMERVKIYFKEIAKQLTTYQIQNGGPIIMVQMEKRKDMSGDERMYREIICQAGFNKVLIMGSDWTSLSSIKWKVVFEES